MAYSVDILPTMKQFLLNLEEKIQDPSFEGDMYSLLRPGIEYDQTRAYELIKTEILENL